MLVVKQASKHLGMAGCSVYLLSARIMSALTHVNVFFSISDNSEDRTDLDNSL